MAALEKLRKLVMIAGARAKTTERFDRLMKKVSWKPDPFMSQYVSLFLRLVFFRIGQQQQQNIKVMVNSLLSVQNNCPWVHQTSC